MPAYPNKKPHQEIQREVDPEYDERRVSMHQRHLEQNTVDPCSGQVGDSVKVYSKSDNDWYPGQIADILQDGKYLVSYTKRNGELGSKVIDPRFTVDLILQPKGQEYVRGNDGIRNNFLDPQQTNDYLRQPKKQEHDIGNGGLRGGLRGAIARLQQQHQQQQQQHFARLQPKHSTKQPTNQFRENLIRESSHTQGLHNGHSHRHHSHHENSIRESSHSQWLRNGDSHRHHGYQNHQSHSRYGHNHEAQPQAEYRIEGSTKASKHSRGRSAPPRPPAASGDLWDDATVGVFRGRKVDTSLIENGIYKKTDLCRVMTQQQLEKYPEIKAAIANHEASRHWLKHGCLGPDVKLTDGFTCIEAAGVDLIVLDSSRDIRLQMLLQYVRSQLTFDQEQNVRMVVDLVFETCGGTMTHEAMAAVNLKESFPKENLLGQIIRHHNITGDTHGNKYNNAHVSEGKGVCRHRSLIFKYVCDQLRLCECWLVDGVAILQVGNESDIRDEEFRNQKLLHRWNVVSFNDASNQSRRALVDCMTGDFQIQPIEGEADQNFANDMRRHYFRINGRSGLSLADPPKRPKTKKNYRDMVNYFTGN
eukprot:gnl/MRDRNA2_/MRDRNA2_28965_c0_seq1.p1 gnl/MRDRNA2_/MRDRNA2_28965_c0~~gnl/MRDRNA2_/MRDRNA2_28965_c0_seq1.p1  ORF type:complete len:588 (+),score=62.34 gnl/MRDRNA2_/MRDRNA2_28965_c0_seq1:108-1871(+)